MASKTASSEGEHDAPHGGWLPHLVALALVAVAYHAATACDFVFDDHFAVLHNADVQPDASLLSPFRHDFWGRPLHAAHSHKSYRPLTVLSFRLHTLLTRRPPQPAHFHAVNVLLHALVTVAVARYAAACWGGADVHRQRRALVAGAWFAIHPVHVEAVTGTVGRAELLCALACLSASACHEAASDASEGGAPKTSRRRRAVALIGLVVTFGAALLCKETAVVFAGIAAARELTWLLDAQRRRSWRAAVARLALIIACCVAYARLRVALMSADGSTRGASLAESRLIRRAENPLLFVDSAWEYALSVGYIQVVYARLLLWPSDLCIEYSFECIPMVATLWDARNLLTVALLAAVGAGATALAARTLRCADARSSAMACAWLFLPWLLVSHVPLRLGTLIAERTMYMPSIGAALLISRACALAAERAPRGWRGLLLAAAAVTVASFTEHTMRRTAEWRTDRSAFSAALRVCPRSAKLNQQMCTLLTNDGELSRAQVHCARAREIDPTFCDVDQSEGHLRLRLGDIDGGVAALSRAVQCEYTGESALRSLLKLRELSVWNEASLFTGWADVELTTLGKNEAAQGATQLWREGISIDVAYTSLLKRAQQTLDIVLRITGQEDVPVHQNWRLNERMYGGLTGLNKKETVAKYGEDQVKQWRRSFSTPPPEIEKTSEYWPGNDNKYAHIADDLIPLSECLKDTVDRCLPYWEESITPALSRGKTVLVAAHGNSIRGILKYLDNISDDEITKLEIPTGIPLVYELDADLRPIPSSDAVAPLSGRFLTDPEELKRKQEEVANQSKLRYNIDK